MRNRQDSRYRMRTKQEHTAWVKTLGPGDVVLRVSGPHVRIVPVHAVYRNVGILGNKGPENAPHLLQIEGLNGDYFKGNGDGLYDKRVFLAPLTAKAIKLYATDELQQRVDWVSLCHWPAMDVQTLFSLIMVFEGQRSGGGWIENHIKSRSDRFTTLELVRMFASGELAADSKCLQPSDVPRGASVPVESYTPPPAGPLLLSLAVALAARAMMAYGCREGDTPAAPEAQAIAGALGALHDLLPHDNPAWVQIDAVLSGAD